MSDYCKKRKSRRRGSKRLIREQKNERWMLQAEQSKEQWIDGSGSKGWIKEKFEGALDQGASCSSGKNRRSDYYALMLLCFNIIML